jgi:hypothetical protein
MEEVKKVKKIELTTNELRDISARRYHIVNGEVTYDYE